ncbi:MAG: hypothetical protein ACFE8J_18975, partial [Candidatus Heimdallarchaeota archaeon]
YLEDISEKPSSKKKNSKELFFESFIEIGEDYESVADITKLNDKELKIMYQIFISRELNNKMAVKWRFYQYLKYYQDFIIESIKINRTEKNENSIDFIIETKNGKIIFLLCYDLIDLNKYNLSIANIEEFAKKHNIVPDQVILATNKTYRDLPIETSFKINNNEIIPELFIEWIDDDCPFTGYDLIIVNDNELKIAGFNFANINNLLEYTFEYSNGGQISIFKQENFYSDNSDEELEIELIWKGIMIK